MMLDKNKNSQQEKEHSENYNSHEK